MKMTPLGWIAFVLVVVGGLNWGLVGAFNFNLVSSVLGGINLVSNGVKIPILQNLVYILVGLSAIVMLIPKLAMAKETKKRRR